MDSEPQTTKDLRAPAARRTRHPPVPELYGCRVNTARLMHGFGRNRTGRREEVNRVGTQIATREATPRYPNHARLTVLFRSDFWPMWIENSSETTSPILSFVGVRPPVLPPQPILRKTAVPELPNLAILPGRGRFSEPFRFAMQVVTVVGAAASPLYSPKDDLRRSVW